MDANPDVNVKIVGFKGAYVRTCGFDVVVNTDGPILRPPETAVLRPEEAVDVAKQMMAGDVDLSSPRRYGVIGPTFDLANFRPLVDAAAQLHLPIEFHLFPTDF